MVAAGERKLGNEPMRAHPPENRLLLALLYTLAAVCILSSPAVSQEEADTTAVLDDSLAVPAAIPPAPPTNVRAADAPGDHGHAIQVEWDLSADDGQGRNNILMYKVLRSPSFAGPVPVEEIPAGDASYRIFESAAYGAAGWRLVEGAWDTVGQVPFGETSFENRGGKFRDGQDFLPDFVDFRYRVVAQSVELAEASSEPSAPVQAYGQMLNLFRHMAKCLTWTVFCT
jgi:hypothetical protein